MKIYFYKGYGFKAENWETAEKYVAENWGFCDADELFEMEEED